MKANLTLNKSLFRTFGGSTASLSSTIVLCHPLSTIGSYEGVVYRNKQVTGQFTVSCDETAIDPQVDIDLPTFTSFTQSDCNCQERQHFQVKKSGYLVFFSSTGEDGYHVELTSTDKQREASVYTTQKPVTGDIVLCTLLRPGAYQVTDDRNHQCTVSVGIPDDRQSTDTFNPEKHTIRLSATGFSTQSMSIVSLQPVIVALETNTGLIVKLVEPYKVDEPTDTPKRFRWQKPTPRR